MASPQRSSNEDSETENKEEVKRSSRHTGNWNKGEDKAAKSDKKVKKRGVSDGSQEDEDEEEESDEDTEEEERRFVEREEESGP